MRAGCTIRRGSGAGVPSVIGGSGARGLRAGGAETGLAGGVETGLAGGVETGLGAGHAASAALVAASCEEDDSGGWGDPVASPSFNNESGVTGGPATRSAWVSGIETAIL